MYDHRQRSSHSPLLVVGSVDEEWYLVLSSLLECLLPPRWEIRPLLPLDFYGEPLQPFEIISATAALFQITLELR